MASIGPSLRAFLLADPAIAALVVDRAYPSKLPQGVVTPAIRYSIISGERVQSTKGPMGLASPRIQIDAWATTFVAARELADLIETRLDGYRGQTGGSPDMHIQGAFIENERDDWEPESELYAFIRDYRVHYGY